MTHIKIITNGDRLGGNLSSHLATIFYAHYYNLPVKYGNDNHHKQSIFMKALETYIEKYNKNADLENKNKLLEFKNHENWYSLQAQTLSTIRIDYVSYFKKYFYNELRTYLDNYAKDKKYHIPFSKQKSILIHLRLNDAKHMLKGGTPDRCNDIYKNFINNNNFEACSKICRYRQSPINFNHLNKLINEAKSKYKDREVIIVTNPGEKINLPYRVISNNDVSLDLYLLCNSEVIITSRSTFGFIPLLIGIVKEAWVPKWCHFAMFGLTTKYDKNINYNYY